MNMTSKDYVDYINKAAAKIEANGDYITELDAVTGDGDHFANMQMGFSKLVEMSDELSALSVSDCFKKIGMTMMSVIGGSSGVLYGSAYIAGAKALQGKETIDESTMCDVLAAELEAIMKRGQAEPGFKTMIDALHPAVEAYKAGLAAGKTGAPLYAEVKAAAAQGAQDTMNMEAVKGRAYYQANKGVGHIDPGAMTMAYQIETLMDCMTALA